MGDINYPPGATAQQVMDMIATGGNFVGAAAPMTLDALITNYPASAPYKGMYARVSNLYNGVSTSAAGGIDDIVRCRFDEANSQYRWVPIDESFNASAAPTGGTQNLVPLVTPPTLRLTGTLLGNLSVVPSAVNAYIGQKFTVIQNSTLGIFVTTITGLIGSNLTLLGNSGQKVEYTASGWSRSVP